MRIRFVAGVLGLMMMAGVSPQASDVDERAYALNREEIEGGNRGGQILTLDIVFLIGV